MQARCKATPWLQTHPHIQDRLRLFCFPYAGGGTSMYRGWAHAFPQDVGVYPVQLPGRETRIAERLIGDMGQLATSIAEAIAPYLQLPFILFGHSLGARIAFEVARHVRRKWGVEPCHLIVSASRAPHIPDPNPLHKLPDDRFIAELRRLSGTPEAILQNKELLALFLPMLRADFTVDETYQYKVEQPLACPILAFGGTWDEEATDKELEAWARHTQAEFGLEMIAGNHFFLHAQQPVLLKSIWHQIKQYYAP